MDLQGKPKLSRLHITFSWPDLSGDKARCLSRRERHQKAWQRAMYVVFNIFHKLFNCSSSNPCVFWWLVSILSINMRNIPTLRMVNWFIAIFFKILKSVNFGASSTKDRNFKSVMIMADSNPVHGTESSLFYFTVANWPLGANLQRN